MILRIENLHKSYKSNALPVLQGIDYTLNEGEVSAIVGKSGSGKSTILKIIAGLEPANQGRIELNDREIQGPSTFLAPEKRKIGYLFQDFALFPHLTVAKNISFGLSGSRNKQERIQEMLHLAGLDMHHAKYPHELSGGEQQRAALARAMAPNPSLLLLDEPFSNLDTHIKKDIRAFVFSVIRSSGLSCVFVTHDLEDVMEYADTLSILHKGRIEQRGAPDELYRNPVSPHVAGYFGEINMLGPEMIDRFELAVPSGMRCGVRTCDIQCSLSNKERSIPARIIQKTSMGSLSKVQVEILEGSCLNLTLPHSTINGQEEVFVSIATEDILQFPGQ